MILIRHGQSAFNVHYAKTRCDPGIVDPPLTEEGRRQAAAVGKALRHEPVRRVIASPYTRALETAGIIAGALDLPVTVEAVIGERAAFICDIGSRTSELCGRFPEYRFDHLEETWWPALTESDAALAKRAETFRRAMAARDDWHEVAVVSHWAFIRALTGQELGNCQSLRFDPTATS